MNSTEKSLIAMLIYIPFVVGIFIWGCVTMKSVPVDWDYYAKTKYYMCNMTNGAFAVPVGYKVVDGYYQDIKLVASIADIPENGYRITSLPTEDEEMLFMTSQVRGVVLRLTTFASGIFVIFSLFRLASIVYQNPKLCKALIRKISRIFAKDIESPEEQEPTEAFEDIPPRLSCWDKILLHFMRKMK